MKSNQSNGGRYCGNCDGHNCYDYPSKVFCSTRYAQNMDPIVDTLWCCSDWSQVSQDCFCVEEAKKAREAAVGQR